MFEGLMRVAHQERHYSPVVSETVASTKHRKHYGPRRSLSMAARVSLVPLQTEESRSPYFSCKVSGLAPRGDRGLSPLISTQANTVGIIGGFSDLSTSTFLEKLAWWSAKDGEEECLPFVVCSDPSLSGMQLHVSNGCSIKWDAHSTEGRVVENLKRKREFLEKSGAQCIVMPCHLSHTWHSEISEGCLLPFLHICDCVAIELEAAKLRPIEAGSDRARVGILAADYWPSAKFYQDKLQGQGFEVVLPDKATTDRILTPAYEALNRKDKVGARNLARIAIHLLLVKAVNTVILASDELQGLLPHDDPLLKRCIDPLDSLARSTIMWAKDAGKINMHTRT